MPEIIPKTPIPTNITKMINEAQNPSILPNASDVYSAQNVNQALTQPTKAVQGITPTQPQYALGSLEEQQNLVTQTQQKLADLQKTGNLFAQAIKRQNEGAYGSSGVSMNVMGLQGSRFNEQQSMQVQDLQNTLSLQQQELNRRQGERDKMETLMKENPGAGILPTDNFESAIKKSAEWQYNEEQRKIKEQEAYTVRAEEREYTRMKETEKRAIKQDEKKYEKMRHDKLRDLAVSLGVKNAKKMSKRELETAVSKENRKQKDIQERMKKLELKMKESAYRKSFGASDDENVDIVTISEGEFPDMNNPLPNNTKNGDNRSGKSYLNW